MVTFVFFFLKGSLLPLDKVIPWFPALSALRGCDEFCWPRSGLAQQTHFLGFMSLGPRCGIQDTRKHDAFAPAAREGEGSPGVLLALALAPGCLMTDRGWQGRRLGWATGHLGCDPPESQMRPRVASHCHHLFRVGNPA